MRVLIVLAAIWLSTPLWAAEVYIFRHAETESATVTDPQLSATGQRRANWLAEYLVLQNPEYLHSTDTSRTRQSIQPLQQRTELEVQHYEPTELAALIEKIQQGGVHVVASHRGAIMGLIQALGGDLETDIDDSEYDRLYHLTVTDNSTKVRRLSSEPAHPKIVPTPFVINPNDISLGQYRYQMLFQDQPVGEAVWEYAQDQSGIHLQETTRLERFQTEANIKVDLETNLSAGKMTFGGTFFGSPADISIAWNSSKVKGHSQIPRQPYRPQGRVEVDQDWPAGTMERSAALMLAHALRIPEPDQPYAFRWFNTYDATIRDIRVDNLGVTEIEQADGSMVQAVQLRLLGGAPSQIFYLSMERPRKVLRIDIINAPWCYQLIESKHNN